MLFENTVEIGTGAYTITEIARILQLPVEKVRRWIKDHWDGTLGKAYARQYSWKNDGSKAVSFHTLIECYVMMQLSDAGVQSKAILKAHEALSYWFKNLFPFAIKTVLIGNRNKNR